MGNCPTIYEDIDHAIIMVVSILCPDEHINIIKNNKEILEKELSDKEINELEIQKPKITTNLTVEDEEKLDILIHVFTPTNANTNDVIPDYITNTNIKDDNIITDYMTNIKEDNVIQDYMTNIKEDNVIQDYITKNQESDDTIDEEFVFIDNII